MLPEATDRRFAASNRQRLHTMSEQNDTEDCLFNNYDDKNALNLHTADIPLWLQCNQLVPVHYFQVPTN